MLLSKITLQGFRSFEKEKFFTFDPRFTLIVGPNSVGKTNLLEAIYLVSKNQGFREKKLLDLIGNSSEGASVIAEIQEGESVTKLEVRISKKGEEITKLQYVNDLHKTIKGYRARAYNVVLFQPDDLQLVSGNGSLRRQYIDRLLSAIDYEYYRAKTNFEQGVYKRNKILENKEHYGLTNVQELLKFWDEYLSKQIRYLNTERQKIVDYFNEESQLNGMRFKIIYQPNEFINSSNKEQLEHELRVRRTSTGPSLDDFIFLRLEDKKTKNLAHFGSRSEQRLAILWLKINELRYFKRESENPPILLMDDIFSELDEENSARILKVAHEYQTVVTTAHLEVIPLIKFPIKQITLGP